MNNVLRELLKISVLVFVLVAVQSFAFSEPTSVPPVGNVAAPINTSGVQQTKAGNLILNSGLSVNASTWLAVLGGNVGIGNQNPGQKLDVTGQIHATGDICTDAGGGACLSIIGVPRKKMYDTPGSYTFTVPAGVTKVYVSGSGGGGGGGGGDNFGGNNGSGGGGADSIMYKEITVTPLASYAIVVGAGGAGGAMLSNGQNGNSSSFGSLLVLNGGGGAGFGGGGGVAGGPGGTDGFEGNGPNQLGAMGGSTLFGPGSNPLFSSQGKGYGSGGAGGREAGSGTPTGGKGANGFIMVEW